MGEEDLSPTQKAKNIFLSIILVIFVGSLMITLIKCVGCKIEREKKKQTIMVQQKSSEPDDVRVENIV